MDTEIIPQADTFVNAKWATVKRRAAGVSKTMLWIGPLRARGIRMGDCSNRLEYTIENGRMKLKKAYLCRDRLCPICNWRLGVKRLSEAISVCGVLAERYPKAKAIHIVLTVRNCNAGELGETIRRISEGFTRLRKRALWKEYILGYARSIEITYNHKTGTYHPHIHIVAIVGEKYVRQISIGDWIDMWRDCAKLNYKPIVWAEHAYKRPPKMDEPSVSVYGTETLSAGLEKRTEDERIKALREAIKYALKPAVFDEMLKAGDTLELSKAVGGVKLIAYGGIMKEIRAELGITDHEAPDLAPEESIELEAIKPEYLIVYEWAMKAGEYRRVV